MLLVCTRFECKRVACVPTYPTLRIRSVASWCWISRLQFCTMPGRPYADVTKVGNPPFSSAGSLALEGGVKLGKPASSDCTGVKPSCDLKSGLTVVPLVSESPKSE